MEAICDIIYLTRAQTLIPDASLNLSQLGSEQKLLPGAVQALHQPRYENSSSPATHLCPC